MFIRFGFGLAAGYVAARAVEAAFFKVPLSSTFKAPFTSVARIKAALDAAAGPVPTAAIP
jgi:hypothetical protein